MEITNESQIKHIMVVGENYRALTVSEGVMCISDVEELLESRPDGLEYYVFELGKGVPETRMRRLLELSR